MNWCNFASSNAMLVRLRIFCLLNCLLAIMAVVAQPAGLYHIAVPVHLKNQTGLNRVERYLASLDEDALIEGSMYLDDEFAPGRLQLGNNQYVNDCFFRYNMFRDEMEFVTPEGDTLVLQYPAGVKELKIGRKHYAWVCFIHKKNEIRGYMEVLNTGRIRLLKRTHALFEPSNPPYTALHIGNKYDRFVKVETWYIQHENQPAVKLRRTVSGLKKCFPAQSEFIHAYCRTNGLNLRNDHHLLALLKALQTQ